jgi:hypothetical protein
VFGSGYHHSPGIIGTDFLALGLGMIIAALATVKAQEVLFAKDDRGGKQYAPESRYVDLVPTYTNGCASILTDVRPLSGLPGAALCAGGLFIYGFTAVKTHFIVVSCIALRERATEQRLI